jgi:hypothetical protein
VGKAKSSAGTGREIPMSEDLEDTLTAQVTWLKKCFDAEPRTDWHLLPFSNRVRPADPLRPATTIKTAWESVRTAAPVKCRLTGTGHFSPAGTTSSASGERAAAVTEMP